MDNRRYWDRGSQRYQGMDVVWHHYPGKRAVAQTIKMQKSLLNEASNAYFAQIARTVTGIQRLLATPPNTRV